MRDSNWAPPASWGVGAEPTQTLTQSSPCVELQASLTQPLHAWGLVVMPHLAPGGVAIPHSAYLARLIRGAGVATLVCELVGVADSDIRAPEDLDLLALHLDAWLQQCAALPSVASLPVALVAPGAAFCAAAMVAAWRPGAARTLVAYGGRPDLAAEVLPRVRVPSLFVTGEHDDRLQRLTRSTISRMRCVHRLEPVTGARHQFTGHGDIARLAPHILRWLRRYLPVQSTAPIDSPVLRLMVDRATELSTGQGMAPDSGCTARHLRE